MRAAGRSLQFTDIVKFRGEAGFSAAVVEAARRSRTSTPEYLRRIVRERLAADGIALPDLDAPAMQKAA